MKHALVGLTALCSVVCLTMAPRAEARSIRADRPQTAGCQIANWSTNADPNAGIAALSPGGVSSSTDSVVTCTSSGNNSVDPNNISSFFVTNDNVGPPYGMQTNETYGATSNASYLATSGELYQFVSTANGNVDADVVVWNLSNSDTEIELNNWCNSGTTGASVSWGKNTYTGGCNSATNDLLFNKAGSLIGYVTDSTSTLTLVTATSLPADWKSSTVSAPEIDPASAIGALTLLAGCLAVLRRGRAQNASGERVAVG
jgi:hypothetical protein